MPGEVGRSRLSVPQRLSISAKSRPKSERRWSRSAKVVREVRPAPVRQSLQARDVGGGVKPCSRCPKVAPKVAKIRPKCANICWPTLATACQCLTKFAKHCSILVKGELDQSPSLARVWPKSATCFRVWLAFDLLRRISGEIGQMLAEVDQAWTKTASIGRSRPPPDNFGARRGHNQPPQCRRQTHPQRLTDQEKPSRRACKRVVQEPACRPAKFRQGGTTAPPTPDSVYAAG